MFIEFVALDGSECEKIRVEVLVSHLRFELGVTRWVSPHIDHDLALSSYSMNVSLHQVHYSALDPGHYESPKTGPSTRDGRLCCWASVWVGRAVSPRVWARRISFLHGHEAHLDCSDRTSSSPFFSTDLSRSFLRGQVPMTR